MGGGMGNLKSDGPVKLSEYFDIAFKETFSY